MIITCNECNSSFKVEDSLIKESGSKVRCSKCESIFVAYPPPPEEDVALDPDEQLLGSDGNIVLDNLDSTLDDFFNEEASPDTTAAKDADEELELGLGLDAEPDKSEDSPSAVFDSEEKDLDLDELQDLLETEHATDDTVDELDLDMTLGENLDTTTTVDSMVDEELPDLEDLEDLSALEDVSPSDVGIESDLDGLDLDLDADKETENAEGDPIMNEASDLTDIELREEESPDFETTSVTVAEDQELDMQPDMATHDQPVTSDPEVVQTDELNLADLELDTDETPADGEITESGAEVMETDELDLADLELDTDESPVAETAGVEKPDETDLDLQLELEGETFADEETTGDGVEVTEADGLDLSELELESDDAPVAETTSETEPEELDLEFDPAPEAVGEDSAIGSDSLDLSDLEEIIDSEPEDASETASGGLEMDLDDQDGEKAVLVESEDAVDDNELDFSDLENMLESGDTPKDEAEGQEIDDLELQFDIGEQPAGDVNAETKNDMAEEFEEDGLLDIEKILEEGEDTADEVSDSPLEMESAIDDSSSEEEELELDFDLEGELQEKENLSDDDSADELLESSLIASGEIDEEESDDESLHAATADAIVTDDLGATKDEYSQTDVSPAAVNRTAVPPPRARKSRLKVPVLAAVLLLLLAGGILVVPNLLGIKIPYISDINIPYVSDLFSPKAKDVAGILEIIPLGNTISAKFVEGSKGDRLLVIHGKIKNDYDHPRSFIKVTGKIYQKGGKLAKTETVYCGNVLSDSELSGMNIAAIGKRLHNRFGDKKSNYKVKTGKSLPFMIVFDKLPQNLDEYTVEVAGSSI